MAKMAGIRWLRLLVSLSVFMGLFVAAWYYQTSIYLIYQASGQMKVLMNTQSIESFERENKLTLEQIENLELVKQIKQYSVDSLGYKPTGNFTRIFNQDKVGLLWVITACKPYSFDAYEWRFPLLGRVTYKGFFKKELAEKEYNHLVCQGFDVDLRSVSAWSTLGWFNDPLLSGMLNRSKGGLCNLLFHELFHATYYAPNAVDLNENIASFVAHKATLRFLAKDTANLRNYKESFADNEVYYNFMLRGAARLSSYYKTILDKPDKYERKLRALFDIADSVRYLPLHNKNRFLARREDMTSSKNAYFIDFRQYDSLQDSLDKVFNKIYRGDLKKLVQDLKQNGIYY